MHSAGWYITEATTVQLQNLCKLYSFTMNYIYTESLKVGKAGLGSIEGLTSRELMAAVNKTIRIHTVLFNKRITVQSLIVGFHRKRNTGKPSVSC